MSDKTISNMNINKDNGSVVITINPNIYSLDVIYAASYVFLNKAYIVIDGDPETEIKIELIPKQSNTNLLELGGEFNNEILNYATYKVHSEKNAAIRQMVIQKALFTNDPELETIFKVDDEDESYLDDPEGIAVPWEEKFGDKDDKE